MKLKNCTFPEARDHLAAKCGIEIPQDQKSKQLIDGPLVVGMEAVSYG
jgi:DNA primase